MSFKEPIPALSNVMDTNEHASSSENVVFSEDVVSAYLTGYRDLEVRGPGAVAHMSLHQKLTMSKSHQQNEADSKSSPIFKNGGLAVRSMLATNSARAVETVYSVSVRGHIWAALSRVNAFLQFYYAIAEKTQKTPDLPLFRRVQMGSDRCISSAALRICGSSRRNLQSPALESASQTFSKVRFEVTRVSLNAWGRHYPLIEAIFTVARLMRRLNEHYDRP